MEQTLPSPAKAAKKTVKIALAGNPNCGKTTLFNKLTGANQYVGNWPGVTVEKKEGRVKYKNRDISIIDLPGIYSLSPYTPEEIVTRNCLLHDKPDVIINIIDATNMERNLYLTTQIAELGRPMLLALNMVDLLEKEGDQIDYTLLEKELSIPVVPISASRGKGMEELIARALEVADHCDFMPVKNIYSKRVDSVLTDIEDALKEVQQTDPRHRRFIAVKLFEGDSVTWSRYHFTKQQRDHIEFHINEIETTQYIDREMIIADERYKYICAVCKRAVHKKHPQGYVTFSDKIDQVVTNRYLALPLFLLLMLAVFFITFGPLGTCLKDGAPMADCRCVFRFCRQPSDCMGRLRLGAKPAFGWGYRGRGLGYFVFTADYAFIYAAVRIGRQRLYGAGRFYYG